MAASSTAVRRRAAARSRLRTRRGFAGLVAVVVAAVVVVPLVFAGSTDRLADGTRIAGVDVGGMTPTQARALLEMSAARLERVPVTFTAGGKRFRLTAHELGVSADWSAAVDRALGRGGGSLVVRGFRRLSLELFPQDVAPPVHAYGAAVDYELGRIARAVDAPHRDARLVRHGLHVTIAAARTGVTLDRRLAAEQVVASLASLSRSTVQLPVSVDPPRVTAAALEPAEQRASLVVSGAVRARVGAMVFRIARWRLATIIDLRTLSFTGPAADAWFARLAKNVDRPAKDATFAVGSAGVRVVPAVPGFALDQRRAAGALLAAASRPSNRAVALPGSVTQPRRSTRAALAMGITGTVSSYETIYGGDPNRIHNVQLVARLIDGTLIAPGTTFSFNATTGERTAAKGFLEAPVIVNGELQTGLGGGVCQVSTTVFNAAFEAGLPITARTNHALYISHYPLGRDATVDYPDVDLKFVNDTGHWLLLRTFVGASSLTVGLYGTPTHRHVVAFAQPLHVVAAPPTQKTVDPSLKPGQVVVDDPGVPAQSTSVERKVYSASGTLLSSQTWFSSYRAEPRLVRVGPKAKAKAKKPKTPPPATSPTTTPDRPH